MYRDRMSNNYYGGGYGQPYRNTNSLIDFNTFNPQFIGRPVEDIRGMVHQQDVNTRQLVDTTSALDITMSNLNINPEDEAGQVWKQQQQEAFRGDVQSIIDNEDYKLAPAIINKTANDFIKNKGLQEAVDNNVKYEEWKAGLQERSDKGLLSDAQYADALTQPPASTDLISDGIYNKFEPKHYVKPHDIQGDLESYGQKYDATTIQTSPIYTYAEYDKDGNGIGIPTGTKYVRTVGKDRTGLKKGLYDIINNNPEALAFVRQESGLLGVSEKEYIDKFLDPVYENNAARSIYNMGSLYQPTIPKAGKPSPNSRTHVIGQSAGLPLINNYEEGVATLRGETSLFTKGKEYVKDNISSIPGWEFTLGLGKSILEAGEDAIQGASDTYNKIPKAERERLDREQAKVKPLDPRLANLDDKMLNLTTNMLKYNYGIDKPLNELTSKELKKLSNIADDIENAYKDGVLNSVGIKYNVEADRKEFLDTYFGDKTGTLTRDKTGNFPSAGLQSNTLVYDPNLDKVVTLEKYMELVNEGSNDLPDKVSKTQKVDISPVMNLTYKNSIYTLSGNEAFIEPVVVNFNGHEIYFANPLDYSLTGNTNVARRKLVNLKDNNQMYTIDISEDLLPTKVLKNGKVKDISNAIENKELEAKVQYITPKYKERYSEYSEEPITELEENTGTYRVTFISNYKDNNGKVKQSVQHRYSPTEDGIIQEARLFFKMDELEAFQLQERLNK